MRLRGSFNKREWDQAGWLLAPSLLEGDETSKALEGALTIIPSAEEFQRAPAKFGDLVKHEFAAMVSFPFDSVVLSLIAVHTRILSLVADILETRHPILYQAQLWAKYSGAVAYDQTHHRDYAKNTMITPAGAHANDFVEAFLYLTDVELEDGPTALVAREDSTDLPLEPARYSRSESPFLYANETYAVGPAGTLLCYAGDTFHRGTELIRPGGARIALKLAFRRPESTWVAYHTPPRVGFEPAWSRFVLAADPVQLAALGFPCHRAEGSLGLAESSIIDYADRYAERGHRAVVGPKDG
jgi:ectoine hydroxylase-related dioxygenase (phytanoyl-CoA dioxygenase family)